eukprot:TRINITY_DN120931_c0_g1_i1.p1 TRINITY_DN120931_c0_g1~~TRINITY_DN120931_c0_g1_i1.p1  ORF type:complete len:134 (+),score=36.99 TRINITY_DN120931_c0_g1_i1:416-817(+)
MDSWRLVLWAEKQGQGEDLIAAIGRRYFEQKRQLADHSMLLSAVGDVEGLDREAAETVLAGSDFQKEVVDSYRWATDDLGVHSIPVFLFSDTAGGFRKIVHGSASTADFLKVFAEASSVKAGSVGKLSSAGDL